MKKIYIIGAGITGLSAGRKLAEAGYAVTVLEKNAFLGGMAATFKEDDILLDLGPHKIFSSMTDILDDAKQLIGQDLLVIKKKSRICLHNRFLGFPVRLKDLIFGLNPITALQCFIGGILTAIRNIFVKKTDVSYEDWVINRFGTGVYELIFKPYALKLWGDPKQLHTEIAETRIAVPNLFRMIKHMVFKMKDDKTMHAEEFYYAKYGSATLAERLADAIKNKGGFVHLKTDVARLNCNNNAITAIEIAGGETISVQDAGVINTMPLNTLKNKLPYIPSPVQTAIDKLRTRNVILYYTILNKEHISDDNWIFFPGKEYIFNRLFEQKNFSAYMVPSHKTVICVEITCDTNDPLWHTPEEDIYRKVIAQLSECGIAYEADVIKHFWRKLEGVYQIYDINYKNNMQQVFSFLDAIANLYSVGRSGGFTYAGMLDCMDIGYKTAHCIMENTKDKHILREQFAHYVVVD